MMFCQLSSLRNYCEIICNLMRIKSICLYR